jgi:uncharacterized alpha-E superfamily protein
MQPDLVVDLLLLDEANPRSVAYQLARLREHVEQLPGSQAMNRRTSEARLALSLLTAVQLEEVRVLIAVDDQGRRSVLEDLLNRLTSELRQLSETLTREYFDHTISPRPFS